MRQYVKLCLTGREDLAKQKRMEEEKVPPMPSTKEAAPQSKGVRDEEDGMEYLDKEVSIRYSLN